MYKERSELNVTSKWKSYVTGLMMRNFSSMRKIDKYFRVNISDSMSKAIEENWLRILGIDYEIISVNLNKGNQPLGIALQGRNVFSPDGQEMIQRHYLKAIIPTLSIGSTNKFHIGDELLEVNGLKIFGMKTKDIVSVLKKLPNNIQFVVARPIRCNNDDISDYGGSEDIGTPISFYEIDDELTSHTSTMKSNSSLFSSTSRDYGSTMSIRGLIDGRFDNVGQYLRPIIGWRGPIVVEFRKRHKESLGLALEEIKDPKSCQLIIVFKIILPDMKAAKDGRLHVGDRLLQVNGKPVIGVGFRKVCQWMKSAPGGRLVLYVCKPHFPACNTSSIDDLPDNYLYQTLSETDKLPKLQEENCEKLLEIPPVPVQFESNLRLKNTDDKLGLFLDIVDNGINGCKIRKIARGIVRDNGTLAEGDYITSISGINLRIDEKNKLENCLRMIAQSRDDYDISFLKKEVLEIHKSQFSRTVPDICPSNNSLQMNSNLNKNPVLDRYRFSPRIDDQDNGLLTSVPIEKALFKTFPITIKNDRITQLGLVLCPSLNEPARYSSIIGISANSLAEKCQLLKINDEILSVNNTSLEYLSLSDVRIYLNDLLETEKTLHFDVRRRCDDDAIVTDNKYLVLSGLTDMYYCSLSKSQSGFGFSVQGLMPGFGVVINDICPGSSADKVGIMKAGHRLVVINDCDASSSTSNDVVNMVKNTDSDIDLVLETPKFREFSMNITKDSSGSFGLNVAGGIDTRYPFAMIESIVQNTTCQYTVQLQSDDIIVEANGISMLNRSHDEIIRILRSLPHETTFKIWRKLPFWKRDFLQDITNVSGFRNYLDSCQFSVTIKKPVSSIPSFGINFNDLVILDPTYSKIEQRCITVISIERNSLCEKYAPEVVLYCYLIAVDGVEIADNVSGGDLKKIIDSRDQVELLLSRELPYKLPGQRNQSSINPLMKNTLESSHESSLSSTTNDPFPLSQTTMALSEVEETIPTPIINERNSDELTESIYCPSTNIDELESVSQKPSGITISEITVPRSNYIELGFRVFGGRNAGPGGESLPIYVVGVEGRGTCNWPGDRQEPWLANGCQLLELNGWRLSDMDSVAINSLIRTTNGDLIFKVLRFDL